MLIGADLIERAVARAIPEDARVVQNWAQRLRENVGNESGAAIALDSELLELIHHYPEREFATRYDKQLPVIVERAKARFSTTPSFTTSNVASGRQGRSTSEISVGSAVKRVRPVSGSGQRLT